MCGLSVRDKQIDAFKEAIQGDPVSAYGGILGLNSDVKENVAKEIVKNFFEIIIAPKYDKDALNILKSKKNLRIIDISKFNYESKTTGKFFDNSFLLQEKDNLVFKKNTFQNWLSNRYIHFIT